MQGLLIQITGEGYGQSIRTHTLLPIVSFRNFIPSYFRARLVSAKPATDWNPCLSDSNRMNSVQIRWAVWTGENLRGCRFNHRCIASGFLIQITGKGYGQSIRTHTLLPIVSFGNFIPSYFRARLVSANPATDWNPCLSDSNRMNSVQIRWAVWTGSN